MISCLFSWFIRSAVGQAINTVLSGCPPLPLPFPHWEWKYSRHYSPLCVFWGGRAMVALGGFGLQEEWSIDGTTVRAGIERPVCVDDGCVCSAPALQRVNGSSMPALLYLTARRFNRTKRGRQKIKNRKHWYVFFRLTLSIYHCAPDTNDILSASPIN